MIDEERKERAKLSDAIGSKAEAALCEWLDLYLTASACERCHAFYDFPNHLGGWRQVGDVIVHRCADGGEGRRTRVLKQEVVLPENMEWRYYHGFLEWVGPKRTAVEE